MELKHCEAQCLPKGKEIKVGRCSHLSNCFCDVFRRRKMMLTASFQCVCVAGKKTKEREEEREGAPETWIKLLDGCSFFSILPSSEKKKSKSRIRGWKNFMALASVRPMKLKFVKKGSLLSFKRIININICFILFVI